MATRRSLEHRESIYLNDYVAAPNDDIEGVVVGLDPDHREALVHEHRDGRPTARMHEMSVDRLVQHEDGREHQT